MYVISISNHFPSLPLSLFQDINKRLSLPADIRLPEGYLEKFAMNSPPFDKPMSRRLRRASLVSNHCASVCVYLHLCAYVSEAAETSFSQLLWSLRHLHLYFCEYSWACAAPLLCFETKAR